MQLIEDLQNSYRIWQAKKSGRGPFTASMLKSFEKNRCQKCDAMIPHNSYRNALVVSKSEVKYLCRGCRGLYIEKTDKLTGLEVVHYATYIAVSIFVNLKYKDYRFSNYDTIKLLREGSPLFIGDTDGIRYGLFKHPKIWNLEKLNKSPDFKSCGECYFGKIEAGYCQKCGTPSDFQWHTRISETQERSLID